MNSSCTRSGCIHRYRCQPNVWQSLSACLTKLGYDCATVDAQLASVEAGLTTIPGASTPSEVFAALDAEAHGIKAFPAEMITPAILRSWRAVMPVDTPLIPVGGIDGNYMAGYWSAGANGFGLDSSLFKPGQSPDELGINATKLVWSLSSAIKT